MENYDIIIIGGGLVGAGLAAALQHSNLRIAIIDARLASNDDPRLFALNTSSCCFLKNLGIWDRLAKQAASIDQVHISHQGHFGAVRLNKEDSGLTSLGHVIPALHIESALNERLLSAQTIKCYRPAQLHTIAQDNGMATVTIKAAEGLINLQAPLIIGADGTESAVRTQLQIPTQIFDYHQSALVTRTTLQRSHQHIAYERFNRQGAIAMLPLINNECATIWTADTQTISQLNELSADSFLQLLQKEFGYRLGRLQAISQRHLFPLRMVRAKKAVNQCVFLLGNSAHTLHPIAAQGFNLALYEVAALAEEMLAKTQQDLPITTKDLEQISRQTHQQQVLSINTSHQLVRMFSRQSALSSLALQIGMLGLDIAMPIKKGFITRMVGRSGRVPQLLL